MAKSIDIKSIFFNGRNYLLCGLTFIAIGLSVSKPLMSLGLIFMCFSWVVDGKIIQKLKAFSKNKTAIVLSSIYLISLLGLIHTSNYEYGIDDIRKKLSLFVIPFILSGFSPLSKKELHFLLKIYVGWVVFSCCWSFCVYFGALNEVIVDKRDYSRFTSHIRFGIEIALSFFISLYFFFKTAKTYKLIWIGVSLILLLSLFKFSMITGTVSLISALVTTTILFTFKINNNAIKYLSLSLIIAIFCGCFWFIKSSINNFYTTNKVDPIKEISKTTNGIPYQKDAYTDNSTLKENGYFLEKNIAWHEFSEAWNKRSKIDFEGKDLKGNWIKNTLIRFVTSKGLRKDKKAINSLTEEEINAIEKGVPNVKYLTMGDFKVRLHKIIWEYDAYKNGRDVNGHSVLMRWEYLKVTIQLIKNNFWFGIGTGDIQDAYKKYYNENNSPLKEHYRRRGHNQYLTYFITLGICGGLWFLFVLFYPFFKLKLYKNYLYLAFFTILCVSMLTEDTLENQVGIYFFVFFNSIISLSSKQTK